MSDLIIWIIFGTIFAASVFVNVLLILYIRKTIVRVFVASEEASEILTRLDAFRTHLVSIYEMEMFYGDETLKSLINHLKAMKKFILSHSPIF